MSIAEITQLIGSLGFPIVCVIFLARHIDATEKEFIKAIENNTLAITELKTMVNEKLKKDNVE